MAERDAMHTVEQALLDDLNTPQAIAALSAPLKAMNELLFTKKGKKVRTTPPAVFSQTQCFDNGHET